MSLLFKHLRVHQVFGANTDVGKTILTSALVRASANSGNVYYLKPVSTGPPGTADIEHIQRYAGTHKDRVHTHCLYQYQEPVSPHLAARLAWESKNTVIPTDETVVNSISHHVRQCASRTIIPAHMYVETAGGVHSPTLSGTTQLDAYRPLLLPTVLVGDYKLGGISSSISAYESLLMRGFTVDAILLFRDEYYRNWEYLQPYFADKGIKTFALSAPPALLPDPTENQQSTEAYYQSLVSEEGIAGTMEHLDACHTSRLEDLESMPKRTLDTIWWPFVQHQHFQKESDVKVIDSAYSDFFSILSQPKNSTDSILQPQLDGSASWWTQAFGHAHPAITQAAARASGRYGHVMFPRATHRPALQLAERLVNEGPGKGWASRAFYSDDGSTAMEVALKMALRAYTTRHGLDAIDRKDVGILGLKGSYHGDTIGAMNACEEGVYTCEWHNAKGFWLDSPTVGIKDGKVTITVPRSFGSAAAPKDLQSGDLSWTYNVESRLDSPLATVYRTHVQNTLDKLKRAGTKLGALVLEPLVLGAGGMLFVDPLFQRILIDTVRASQSDAPSNSWSGLPVIFDEVFVGLYRIGMETTTSILGVNPDISVNAKILTGGLVPLAVTLASDAIFQAFWSESKADSLLHGHSYTAHAVGCEVANESLRIIDSLRDSEEWKEAQGRWRYAGEKGRVWSFWDPLFVSTLSGLESVEEAMTLGTVLAVKFKDSNAGYVSQSAETMLSGIEHTQGGQAGFSSAPGGAPFGVHYRTLGNVAYFMTSLNTSSAVLRELEDKIWTTLAPPEVAKD
ncbi:onanonoxo-7-onima-8-eninoihtemlysoneda [Cylindrobasidium torrendii FP15055 ss-10]|uniref:Onanonoxo-7-onima-8-eninoihtemlysoneda n=1 Tax=Cylindrobasidium torrendii FP15055 ss-10 TaxID=1314674 RepID=A0A0D7BEY0_9AGAR|nr:onanonoxo-7-onima-8-eninoihtemlysoneda [Cylindrobasidium torrendii FP15055 ss-10]